MTMAEGMQLVEEMSSRTVVKVEVLTASDHLLGYVTVGAGRFSDWLNLREELTITLDNAVVRSLVGLERTEIPLEFVLLNRDAILAVIPREPASVSLARERGPRPLGCVEKTRHLMMVRLPPFALRGHIHLAKGADLRQALSTFTRPFIPFTEARMVYTPNPELLWRGEIMLVSRSKTQLYWPPPDLDRR